MSSYLGPGPESPRPFSVISESHQRNIVLPQFPQQSIYSFGPQYEDKLLKLIHRFLELGTDDRFCYVGDSKGSLAPLVQDHFCLLEPILTVLPTHTNEELPYPVAYTGAEEYFKQVAQHPENMPLFDRVLLKDSVQYFTNPKELYKNVMKTVSEFGKMMIIQRPHNVNTLPLFTDAKRRFAEVEDPYITIIKDLQNCGYDVEWEVECVPVIMQKTKWLKMLEDRFPPQLEIIGENEVKNGLRELSEGVLKYEGEVVEFLDRLLFVTATKPLLGTEFATVGRLATGQQQTAPPPKPDNLRFKMEVNEEIAKYIPKKDRPRRVYKQR